MTLTPSVGRATGRQTASAVAFSAGSVVGGGFVALLIWLLSGLTTPIPAATAFGLLVLFSVGAVLHEVGYLRIPVPGAKRQVPRSILKKSPLVAAFQFGVEMGSGIVTHNTSVIPCLCALAILLFGEDPVLAVLTGASFGSGRALLLWLRLASGRGRHWDYELVAKSRGVVVGASLLALPAAVAVGFAGQ